MAWKKQVINPLLLRLDPSEMALLDWLGLRVDDSLLAEIAAADYGYKEEENFQALKPIRDQHQIPVPLRWIPKEVLELMRWSEPDDPAPDRYGSPGMRGHLTRAFCCAVLLKAGGEPQNRDYIAAENDTLIQMIASVLYLGSEAIEAASRFLSWRILRLPLFDGEYPFFALGLLLLRAASFVPGDDGTDLKLLAEWVVDEEKRVRKMPRTSAESEAWLLGLTNYDQRHEVWKRLVQEVLLDPAKCFPHSTASALQGIVKRLT